MQGFEGTLDPPKQTPRGRNRLTSERLKMFLTYLGILVHRWLGRAEVARSFHDRKTKGLSVLELQLDEIKTIVEASHRFDRSFPKVSLVDHLHSNREATDRTTTSTTAAAMPPTIAIFAPRLRFLLIFKMLL
jgi:hypothetical protein